jgi:16S rRNA (guanine(966)-N(2))-methyltransferase RsmD
VRQTLFNILSPRIEGARVLDGYAGTGALGIEALSRGAAHVTFVERDPRAVQLIESNLRPLLPAAAPGRYAIIRAGFRDAIARLARGGFDLVLLDPPYADTAVADVLADAARVAAAGTLIVIEHAARHEAPDERAGLRRYRTVRAGDSALSFYETTHEG